MNRELTNRRILTLALEALKAEREKIDAEILTIQERLGISPRIRRAKTTGGRISPAGRKSISEAMKKHWIERRRRMSKEAKRAGGKAKS